MQGNIPSPYQSLYTPYISKNWTYQLSKKIANIIDTKLKYKYPLITMNMAHLIR